MQAYPRAVGLLVLDEDDAEAGRGEPAPGDLDGYYKGVAPDPGGCTRDICGGSGRTGVFLLVHGPVPARRHVRRTVRTPGRTSSPSCDLPSMTDRRVHHLVTDLRSRLWASSHRSFSAWARACSPIC